MSEEVDLRVNVILTFILGITCCLNALDHTDGQLLFICLFRLYADFNIMLAISRRSVHLNGFSGYRASKYLFPRK